MMREEEALHWLNISGNERDRHESYKPIGPVLTLWWYPEESRYSWRARILNTLEASQILHLGLQPKILTYHTRQNNRLERVVEART